MVRSIQVGVSMNGLFYHEGSGSLVCRLATREPRECVSWTSRWRDCSRALIWSGVGVVIFPGCVPSSGSGSSDGDGGGGGGKRKLKLKSK